MFAILSINVLYFTKVIDFLALFTTQWNDYSFCYDPHCCVVFYLCYLDHRNALLLQSVKSVYLGSMWQCAKSFSKAYRASFFNKLHSNWIDMSSWNSLSRLRFICDSYNWIIETAHPTTYSMWTTTMLLHNSAHISHFPAIAEVTACYQVTHFGNFKLKELHGNYEQRIVLPRTRYKKKLAPNCGMATTNSNRVKVLCDFR